VLELPGMEGLVDLKELFQVAGKRSIVTILVEGGSKLLGSLFDQHLVDKVLVFISPIIIGGNKAKTAVGGDGVASVVDALCLSQVDIKNFGDNILVSGYIDKRAPQKSQILQ